MTCWSRNKHVARFVDHENKIGYCRQYTAPPATPHITIFEVSRGSKGISEEIIPIPAHASMPSSILAPPESLMLNKRGATFKAISITLVILRMRLAKRTADNGEIRDDTKAGLLRWFPKPVTTPSPGIFFDCMPKINCPGLNKMHRLLRKNRRQIVSQAFLRKLPRFCCLCNPFSAAPCFQVFVF